MLISRWQVEILILRIQILNWKNVIFNLKKLQFVIFLVIFSKFSPLSSAAEPQRLKFGKYGKLTVFNQGSRSLSGV